jgi:membrane associated rhomboid family serine protease
VKPAQLTAAVSWAGFTNPKLIDWGLLSTEGVLRRRELHRALTSGLVHADVWHLALNMLTLYFFGTYLEQRVGAAGLLLIYLASLLAGSAWTLLENLRDREYRGLGASGAVSGVVICFALFEPFALMLVFFVPMPAILFAVLYIGWSAFAAGRVRDGIGHEAHLGGAMMGVVLTALFWPGEISDLGRALAGLAG